MNGGKHYTWDEAKRRSNYAKHKVDFAAMHRFNWQTANITLTEEPTEERWLAVGFIDLTLWCSGVHRAGRGDPHY